MAAASAGVAQVEPWKTWVAPRLAKAAGVSVGGGDGDGRAYQRGGAEELRGGGSGRAVRREVRDDENGIGHGGLLRRLGGKLVGEQVLGDGPAGRADVGEFLPRPP